MSTLWDVTSILPNMVLFHSRVHGGLYETATPTFMTKFRSSLIGLSNEVSVISISYLVSAQEIKMFCSKVAVRWYMSASVYAYTIVLRYVSFISTPTVVPLVDFVIENSSYNTCWKVSLLIIFKGVWRFKACRTISMLSCVKLNMCTARDTTNHFGSTQMLSTS